MPESSPSRMSTSATSGLQSLDQLAALGRGAGRAHDLAPLAVEQQLETLAEGLVILDEHEPDGGDVSGRMASLEPCAMSEHAK